MNDSRPQPDAETLEQGRWLFAQDCRFLTAATQADHLPAIGLPEIAFAGRSNVGKSSLVNALTGRRALARTSQTPGRTQQINFFSLADRLILVDLPGFGYALAAKKAIKAWTGLTRHYLKGRVELQRICLLIDARHGAKPPDREIMAELDQAAVSYQVVLTKADKVKPDALARVVAALDAELSKHPAAYPEIAVTSALKGTGIAELRASLSRFAAPAAAG